VPELPEIEVTRRTIHERLVGLKVENVRLKQSGKTTTYGAELAPSLVGQKLTNTGRRGKMLVLEFEEGVSLIVHLMLIGRIAIFTGEQPEPFDPLLHIQFEGNHNLEVRFVAARYIAFVPSALVDSYPAIAKQGPDALTMPLKQFTEAVGKTKGPIKNVFMEQARMAGVGNAYADEILFAAKVHPLTPASSLEDEKIKALHENVAPVLQRAIDLGAAEEYLIYLGLEEGLTRKHDLMKVHGRAWQPCTVCGAKVRKVELGGRSTYYCPQCQPKEG
jgi:formamidopyrimidine-DNA glycosylase